MSKGYWFCVLCLAVLPLAAQEIALTQQEQSVIETIKAKNRTPAELQTAQPPQAPMQAPTRTDQPAVSDNTIQLSEQAKQSAWEEQQKNAEANTSQPAPEVEELTTTASSGTCLTVAFIDIDEAFNQHPRTQAVKKQIDAKIKSKQREVQNAKEVIAALAAENRLLAGQLGQVKPFYERIVTEQPLGPKVPESADTLLLGNTLNRLSFAGCEILSASPLNTPERLEDITERMAQNNKIIAERSFFIDNYKYQTREEILKLEQEEVKAILQDIYSEIKSFAQKRNIGAIVRKDEILYGQQPVNVTKDFVTRLKKSKKYRKKK